MAQSRVYVGIIQPLDYTPFEGDDGKAIFAKGLEEAGEVLEAWKAVRDTKDSFKKNRALEHLKTEVADLFMCAAIGINDATSIIRDCEQRQIERGRISTGGVDEC